MIFDSSVQVSFPTVIRLVLRVGVGNINFITVAIFSLTIPPPGVRSVDVVHVALLQVFAAGAGEVFAQKMAVLPAHVGKADKKESHRD